MRLLWHGQQRLLDRLVQRQCRVNDVPTFAEVLHLRLEVLVVQERLQNRRENQVQRLLWRCRHVHHREEPRQARVQQTLLLGVLAAPCNVAIIMVRLLVNWRRSSTASLVDCFRRSIVIVVAATRRRLLLLWLLVCSRTLWLHRLLRLLLLRGRRNSSRSSNTCTGVVGRLQRGGGALYLQTCCGNEISRLDVVPLQRLAIEQALVLLKHTQ